jgi:gas vesicle protein
MSSTRWPQFLSAFAIGVGVGTAVGVLFAPSAGEDTREYLRDKAQGGLDEASARARKMARRAQKSVGEAADYVRETVSEAAAEGERAYRNAQNASS